MPIIKSAIKRMRQNTVRRTRNFPLRSEMKTVIKKAQKLAKDANETELAKFISHAFSVIDTACKKQIIHPNNAARKKSAIAKMLNALQGAKK